MVEKCDKEIEMEGVSLLEFHLDKIIFVNMNKYEIL